jgi:hypothetical protein
MEVYTRKFKLKGGKEKGMQGINSKKKVVAGKMSRKEYPNYNEGETMMGNKNNTQNRS